MLNLDNATKTEDNLKKWNEKWEQLENKNVKEMPIEDKKRRTNVIAGILEELVSRIHFAYGNEAQNKEFIEKSKHLVRARKKDIVSATKIPFKRKLFMFLVMCGISKKIKKWE